MRLALDEVGEDEAVVRASGKRYREKFAGLLGGSIRVESEVGKGEVLPKQSFALSCAWVDSADGVRVPKGPVGPGGDPWNGCIRF